MMKWIWGVLLSLFFLPFLTGCVVIAGLEGGGEIGIGLRTDTVLLLYHQVDGDKEGKVANIQIEAQTSLLGNTAAEEEESDQPLVSDAGPGPGDGG